MPLERPRPLDRNGVRPGGGRPGGGQPGGAHGPAAAAVGGATLLRALLPLRFFLGVTFLYAGLDKFLNPAFLSESGAGSIGQQLQGFLHGSPLAPLIQAVALPHPLLIGGLMAVAEIAVGVGIVLGLFYRPAAIAGFLVAGLFFLTASWTTQPYYYGPDLPYAAGFLTLALVGRPGPYTLAAVVDDWFGDGGRSAEAQRRAARRGQTALAERAVAYSEDRRAFLQAVVVGGLALLASGGAFSLSRVLNGDRERAPATGGGGSSGASNGAGTSGGAGSSAGASSASGAIGNVGQISQQGSIQFSDPSTGDPAYAVQVDGQVLGFDAVCTHQGCLVQYVADQKIFGCPCHGAAFDATHQAAVIQGPARSPLRQIALRVDGQGNVFVQS